MGSTKGGRNKAIKSEKAMSITSKTLLPLTAREAPVLGWDMHCPAQHCPGSYPESQTQYGTGRDWGMGNAKGATLSRFVAIKTYEIFVYYLDPNDTWGVSSTKH